MTSLGGSSLARDELRDVSALLAVMAGSSAARTMGTLRRSVRPPWTVV